MNSPAFLERLEARRSFPRFNITCIQPGQARKLERSCCVSVQEPGISPLTFQIATLLSTVSGREERSNVWFTLKTQHVCRETRRGKHCNLSVFRLRIGRKVEKSSPYSFFSRLGLRGIGHWEVEANHRDDPPGDEDTQWWGDWIKTARDEKVSRAIVGSKGS